MGAIGGAGAAIAMVGGMARPTVQELLLASVGGAVLGSAAHAAASFVIGRRPSLIWQASS